MPKKASVARKPTVKRKPKPPILDARRSPKKSDETGTGTLPVVTVCTSSAEELPAQLRDRLWLAELEKRVFSLGQEVADFNARLASPSDSSETPTP
jgi:hypothetical protein